MTGKGQEKWPMGPWGVVSIDTYRIMCVSRKLTGKGQDTWPMAHGCIHFGLCVEQANGRKGAHGPWGVAY